MYGAGDGCAKMEVAHKRLQKLGAGGCAKPILEEVFPIRPSWTSIGIDAKL